MGRLDRQVKLRGLRIELGEIENKMWNRQLGVEKAAVRVFDKKHLVGYFVGDVAVQDLREAMFKDLPPYMVPPTMFKLDEFPHTANGKVDLRKLPKPDFDEVGNLDDVIHPTTEQEKIVRDAWSEALNLPAETLSINVDFLRVGGDSISAMRVSSLCRESGLIVSVFQVLAKKTIAKLARVANVRGDKKQEQGEVVGAVPLTPVQLWFLGKVRRGDVKNMHWFNQAYLLKCNQNVDAIKLGSCIDELVSYTICFVQDFSRKSSGEWMQKILPIDEMIATDVKIKKVKNVQQALGYINGLQQSLDITAGPILCVSLIRLGKEQYIFMVVHHLVVDLVSWRVFLADLKSLYTGRKNFPRRRPPSGSGRTIFVSMPMRSAGNKQRAMSLSYPSPKILIQVV